MKASGVSRKKLMVYLGVCLGIMAICVLAFIANAEDDKSVKRNRNSRPDLSSAARVALVIGNADYKEGGLKNPVNDANDMAKTLEELGFSVTLGVNQTRKEMSDAIRSFGDRLYGDKVGLFYYSGHGIRVKEKNYLLPVDANIGREDEVPFEAVPADLVLSKMNSAGNPLNLVILDACRNNPYAKSWNKGADDQGLAGMTPPTGTLIIYAAKPGGVAKDGFGRNSPFTESLKKRVKNPGVDVLKLVSSVAGDVISETGGGQHPWMEGMILGDFYFAESSGAVITEPSEETSLTVNSNLSDAEIWINGKKVGTGEFSSGSVQPGRYRIKVTRDGYRTYETRVDLKEGKSERISAYLKKAEKPVIEPLKPEETEEDNTEDKISNSLGMKFVYIAPGSFMMGSPGDEPSREDDEKQHKVTLTKGFYVQTTEVTQGQWKKIMGNNPSYFKECGDDCPVEQVSWDDAQEFIKKLNKKEGKAYRLPTEAEWEYAARAGTTTPFAFGSCLSTDQANYDGNYPLEGCTKGKYREKTVTVASFASNSWGLYDMHGNVWEWCSDWYGEYPTGAVTDPAGPGRGSYRVLRGGGWLNLACYCRSAGR